MKQFLYVVQDSLSEMVMPPFASPNDKVAKRDFILGAMRAEVPLQDLHLWKIGEFNSAMADGNVNFQLVPLGKPELIDPTLSEVSEIKNILDVPELPEELKENE